MKHTYRTLMLKFFILYFFVTQFGILLTTLTNIYINGIGMKELLEFNIGIIIVEGLIAAAILQGFTIVGLKNARKILQGHIDSDNDYYTAWNEMVSFPKKMFFGMIICGVLASGIFHILDVVYFTLPTNKIDYESFIIILLREYTLALVLAVLIFTGARRLLRPIIIKIPGIRIKDFHKTTFTNNLLIIFGSLFLITALSQFSYSLTCLYDGRTENKATLLSIFLFDLTFATAIFLLSVTELKNDFSVLIEEMASLLKGSRVQLKSKLPIVTNDEIGNLGLIFNKLQEKVSKEYDEIETELQLASSIQQGLLPEGERFFGSCSVAGICKPCHDVGGDFFDIIPLDSNKFTVIIGDVVGKGMPAALIMSAILLLFRNEIRRGGTVPEILDRLNKMIIGLELDNNCVTLGVAVFDTNRKMMQYASAGHVAPYVLKKTGISQLLCSSLPLGIHGEEIYDQIEYTIDEDDRFIFYTDGMIDAFYDKQTSGFDSFEQILSFLDEKLSITRQISSLIDSTEQNGKPEHEDDKTLVIVRYNRK